MEDDRVRHWDVQHRYAGAVLKWYRYWCLEVSFRQHTLGSYILFCRRLGVRLVSDLDVNEMVDLRDAMMEIELALRGHPTFRADHFNYLQMGNGVPLLHFHGIPRYNSPREFLGQRWIDHTWGHPPAWIKQESPTPLIGALHREISLHLSL
jgi:diadenosine tetraphosphate (Ap4A) HIT family hydrolase